MKFIVAVCGVAVACSAVSAQVLRLSVDGLKAIPLDGIGLPTTFGGAGHMGMLKFSSDEDTAFEGVFKQPKGGGPFAFAGGAGVPILTNSTLATDGACVVTGSTNFLDIPGQVSFSALILPCTGSVVQDPQGGYMSTVLIATAFFGQPVFCGVDVSEWFSLQGNDGLNGWLEVRTDLAVGASEGAAELDVYLVIPAPASAALWLAGVAALGRRRR